MSLDDILGEVSVDNAGSIVGTSPTPNAAASYNTFAEAIAGSGVAGTTTVSFTAGACTVSFTTTVCTTGAGAVAGV